MAAKVTTVAVFSHPLHVQVGHYREKIVGIARERYLSKAIGAQRNMPVDNVLASGALEKQPYKSRFFIVKSDNGHVRKPEKRGES
jgi:hypothetical protein